MNDSGDGYNKLKANIGFFSMKIDFKYPPLKYDYLVLWTGYDKLCENAHTELWMVMCL